MKTIKTLAICTLFLIPAVVSAKRVPCKKDTNPISYCDTSAGRLVDTNGSYSKTYCRFTAIMDLQKVSGCCTWQGGVMLVKMGKVICADGTISPVCSIQVQQLEKQHYQESDQSVNINQSSFLK